MEAVTIFIDVEINQNDFEESFCGLRIDIPLDRNQVPCMA